MSRKRQCGHRVVDEGRSCRRSRRRSAGVAWWRAHGCDRRVRGPRGLTGHGRRRAGERRRLRRFKATVSFVGVEVTNCYRHEPPAGVLCQRWPACGACMTQASVGFDRPECTVSGRQQVHRVRSSSTRSPPRSCWSSMSPFRRPSSSPVAATLPAAVLLDFGLAGPPLDVNGEDILTSGCCTTGCSISGSTCTPSGCRPARRAGAERRGSSPFAASLIAGSFGALLVDPLNSPLARRGRSSDCSVLPPSSRSPQATATSATGSARSSASTWC